MDSKGSDENFDIEIGELGEFGELFQNINLLERDPDKHDRHDKINKNHINTCFIYMIRKIIDCYKNYGHIGFSGLCKILFTLLFFWFIFMR